MMTSIPTKERTAGILKVDMQRWTYEDLRQLPETLDRYEIIDGVLYMSPSPHVQRHQFTVGEVYALLRAWIAEHRLGRVVLSPADVVIDADQVLQPDVFVIDSESAGSVGAYVSTVPPLVVEVLSPASRRYDREVKYRAYERHGVQEYWIVDPEEKVVEIYRHTGERFEMHGRFAGDEVANSALLDGLSFSVSRVFPQ